MARGITYEEVAAVADEALGQGSDPTIRSIRERLGTGSPNTIHRHLSTWRNARPLMVNAAPELPASLLQEIARVLSRAVAEARAEVEARLVQAQNEAAELSTVGEEIEAERERLRREISNVAGQTEALSAKVETQGREVERLTAELERERLATDVARTEVAGSRLKIEAQADKISQQTADLVRLTTAHETEVQARIAAEQASAVKDAKIEAGQHLLSAAHLDIDRLTAQVEREQQVARDERARADEQQKLASDAREELAGLRAQLAAIQTKKRGRLKVTGPQCTTG